MLVSLPLFTAWELAYTMARINTRGFGRWGCRETMRILPVIGVGLSPLVQWIVVPLMALRIPRAKRVFWRAF